MEGKFGVGGKLGSYSGILFETQYLWLLNNLLLTPEEVRTCRA